MFFASAIVNIIQTRTYLKTQVEHACREGEGAESVRDGAVPMTGWAYSPVIPDRPRDYVAAFDAAPHHFGARYRQGSPFGVHLLLNVSPEWIEETGDLHAEDNPRNCALYEAAQKFAQGVPGLVAARMDLDEKGGGVVDIFLAPVFPRTSRLRKDGGRGPDIPEISVSKLDALWRGQTNERVAYSGLQTLWAAYCSEHLDPRIQRGRRKSETGREHLTVPEFKAEAALAEAITSEALERKQEVRQLFKELDKARATLKEEGKEIEAEKGILQRKSRELASGLSRAHQIEAQNRALRNGLEAQKAVATQRTRTLEQGFRQVVRDRSATEEAKVRLAAGWDELAIAREDSVRESELLRDQKAAVAEKEAKADKVWWHATELVETELKAFEVLERDREQLKTDRDDLDKEQAGLEAARRHFAEQQKKLGEVRDKWLAHIRTRRKRLEEQLKAQKAGEIAALEARKAFHQLQYKLAGYEADLMNRQSAQSAAEVKLKEDQNKLGVVLQREVDAANRLVAALTNGQIEIARGKILSEEALRQREDLKPALSPLIGYLGVANRIRTEIKVSRALIEARETEVDRALSFILPLQNRLTREENLRVEELRAARRARGRPPGNRGGGMEM